MSPARPPAQDGWGPSQPCLPGVLGQTGSMSLRCQRRLRIHRGSACWSLSADPSCPDQQPSQSGKQCALVCERCRQRVSSVQPQPQGWRDLEVRKRGLFHPAAFHGCSHYKLRGTSQPGPILRAGQRVLWKSFLPALGETLLPTPRPAHCSLARGSSFPWLLLCMSWCLLLGVRGEVQCTLQALVEALLPNSPYTLSPTLWPRRSVMFCLERCGRGEPLGFPILPDSSSQV